MFVTVGADRLMITKPLVLAGLLSWATLVIPTGHPKLGFCCQAGLCVKVTQCTRPVYIGCITDGMPCSLTVLSMLTHCHVMAVKLPWIRLTNALSASDGHRDHGVVTSPLPQT